MAALEAYARDACASVTVRQPLEDQASNRQEWTSRSAIHARTAAVHDPEMACYTGWRTRRRIRQEADSIRITPGAGGAVLLLSVVRGATSDFFL